MCGGIVSAFSAAPAPARARPFPVAVVSATATATTTASAGDSLLRVGAYNAGRIGSYAMAGALAGGLAGGARSLAGVAGVQLVLYWLANLMLVALGLYLMDAWRGLHRLELVGQGLWQRLRPLTARLVPADSVAKLVALGGVWGWLPCGMVYSVLVTAMLSGSAGAGAAVMLAFGLGTLPMLLALGLAGARLRAALSAPLARRVAGVLVLGFALVALARAASGAAPGWYYALCVGGAP